MPHWQPRKNDFGILKKSATRSWYPLTTKFYEDIEMIISNLEYLESAQNKIEGGWRKPTYYQFDIVKSFTFKKVKVNVDIEGNVATASADAVAEGFDTDTKSSAYTFTDFKTSASSSFAQSATDTLFD